MSNDRDKIAKRRERRRRRRLKTSFKIFLVCFFCVAATGTYLGVRYYQMKNMPDPYGKLKDVQHSQKSTYDLTEETREEAEYWVLDVGKGECIYIHNGNTDILIDTGADKKAKKILKEVKENLSGDLDLLVLTSTNFRRTGGLETICKELKPVKVITCPLGQDKAEIMKAIGRDIKVEEGSDTTLTLSTDATFYTFLPEVSSKDPLDQSLMTYFKYGNTGFFAESDAGEEEEARVIPNITVCDATVLARGGSDKVNQHVGDLKSSTFIVSNSKDSGCPSDALVKTLRGAVYATYNSGTIKFKTDGETVESNLESDNRVKEGIATSD